MTDKSSETNKLSPEEFHKQFQDFNRELFVEMCIEFRARGYSPEKIEKEIGKARKEDFKFSDSEKIELELIEQYCQPSILRRTAEIAHKKIFNDCIASLEKDFLRLDEILLLISPEKGKSIYLNLTEKEKLSFEIEIMKVKDAKIHNIIKYKYDK